MNKKILSLLFVNTLVLGACVGNDTDIAEEDTYFVNEDYNDEDYEEDYNDEDYEDDYNDEDYENDYDDEDYEDEDYDDEVSDTYFDDGDFVYKIIEIEEIDGIKGQAGARDNKDILAIELEFTNNLDSFELLPLEASRNTFLAYQLINQPYAADSDSDWRADQLHFTTSFPDDYKPDLVNRTSDSNVKPGETVHIVIGFDIKYPGTEILLRNKNPYTDKTGDLFKKDVSTR